MHRRFVVWSVVGVVLLLSVLPAVPALAGGGCHPESPAPTSAKGHDNVTVPIKGCEYGPTVIHVPEGSMVSWLNHDEVPHTVTGAHLSWGDIDEIPRGGKVEFQFDDSGTYPYYCFLHPGMAGAVVVGDGESDDIFAAPFAPPSDSGSSSDTQASSSNSAPQTDSNSGPSTASAMALAALALMAGVGAGIALKSRIETNAKRLPQT